MVLSNAIERYKTTGLGANAQAPVVSIRSNISRELFREFYSPVFANYGYPDLPRVLEFLLDFFAREIGAFFYNRGLYDAQTLLASRMEIVAEAIYELEKATPSGR